MSVTDDVTDGVTEDVEDVEEWEPAPAELAPAVQHELADLDDRDVVVSAFAGIGGIDLGLERAGYQTGVQIEWDAAASRVLAARFPRAARYGDVRQVSGDAVRRSIAGRPVRVLGGGFPCQDLSVAGRRAGMAGERSGLYGELLRLAAELDPDWLVVENVPGLLSADADPEANDGQGHGPGTGFALFLGDLTGYRPPVPDGGWRNSGVCHGPLGTCAWRILDARHFGVAQRRRRVFVVFHPRDRAAPAAVLLEPEGVRWDPAARRPSWQGAAQASVGSPVRGRPGGADRAGEDRSRAADEDMSPTWAPDVSVPINAPSTGGQRGDLEGMTYVPVATNALDGDVARSLVAQGSSDPHDYSQSTYVAVEDAEVGGVHEYPDGKVGYEPHAPTIVVNTLGKIVDGRQIGHVEATGGDDLAPTVTSKWAKGRGGPAGSETGNLIVVGDGGTDVAHPVTASGTDGMGRGVPAVAYAVAVRGRDGGAQAELGEPDVANTLRAGDGGSSRSQLVLPPGVEIPDGYEVITVEGDIDAEVAARLEAGGAVAFDWQAGGSGDESWRGKARSWIVKRGDYAGALSTSKVQAVVYAVDKERGIPNDEGIRVDEVDVAPTITADGDPAERTDRGTRIVQTYAPEVAAPLTAGSHAPRVSAPGRRQEDEVNLVATRRPFRKSRRAATSEDDETWVEADHANTLNTFDGGDTRATEIVVEGVDVYNGNVTGDVAQTVRGGHDQGTPRVLATHLGSHPGVDDEVTSTLSTRNGDPTVAAVPHAAVRRLTPRECERLQGFPDDWTLVVDGKGKPAADSPRYKQLGNAVCVNVPEWLGCRIRAYDDGLLG